MVLLGTSPMSFLLNFRGSPFFFQAWWLDLPTSLRSGIWIPTPPWRTWGKIPTKRKETKTRGNERKCMQRNDSMRKEGDMKTQEKERKLEKTSGKTKKRKKIHRRKLTHSPIPMLHPNTLQINYQSSPHRSLLILPILLLHPSSLWKNPSRPLPPHFDIPIIFVFLHKKLFKHFETWYSYKRAFIGDFHVVFVVKGCA